MSFKSTLQAIVKLMLGHMIQCQEKASTASNCHVYVTHKKSTGGQDNLCRQVDWCKGKQAEAMRNGLLEFVCVSGS